MKPETALEIIENASLKKTKVAINCRIHPVIFSDWLHQRRILTPDQQLRVDEYLGKLKDLVL